MNMRFLASLAIALTLAAPLVFGQHRMLLTADIPFDFAVGETRLAAGTYDVLVDPVPGTILVRAGDQQHKVFALTMSEKAQPPNDPPVLKFTKYGSQIFLSEIQPGAGSTGRRLLPSRSEKEMQAAIPAQDRGAVVARIKKRR